MKFHTWGVSGWEEKEEERRRGAGLKLGIWGARCVGERPQVLGAARGLQGGGASRKAPAHAARGCGRGHGDTEAATRGRGFG